MSTRLTIVVDVPDVDPTRIDPWDIAENIIDTYVEMARLSTPQEWGEPIFYSAEWEDG